MDNCCGIVMMQSSHPSFINQYKNMVITTQITESIFHSQSCSFHTLTKNHTLVLTSGYLLAKFAEDINTFDINQIKKYVKFGLLKENNKLIELNLLLLTCDKQFVKQLNQCDIDNHIGYILFLEMLNQKDALIIPKYINSPLKQGQQLLTISSPFAIQGQEMYKNYYKKAIISQIIPNDQLDQQLIILDLISQTGQEGGAIFNSNGEFVGMILQNVQIGQIYNKYFTFCMNWKVINFIFQQNFTINHEQQLTFQSKLIDKMVEASIIVHFDFGQIHNGYFINDKKNKMNYILTVQNFQSSNEKDTKILFEENQKKAYLVKNWSNNFDFALFKCEDYKDGGLKIEDFIDFKELEINQTVYMICYSDGVFQTKPYISKGRILKLVLNEQNQNISIVTDCYIKNGLNGGGLFTKEGNLIGIQTFSAKFVSEGCLCEFSFFTPILLFDQLFKDLYLSKEITQFSKIKYEMFKKFNKPPPFLQNQLGSQNPKL